jgi:predicted RND superfamily exporter protein
MLIVVTRHIIVIINIILITIVSLVKLKNLKYTNEFVLHVNEGEQVARSLAEKYQLKFERQVTKTILFFFS